jgi:hypothetical protein
LLDFQRPSTALFSALERISNFTICSPYSQEKSAAKMPFCPSFRIARKDGNRMNIYCLLGDLGQNQGIGLSGGQVKFVPVLDDTGAGCVEIGIKATIPMMQRRTARPAVLFVDMSILSVRSFRAAEAPLACLQDRISAQKSSSCRHRNSIKKKAALAAPLVPKRNFVLFDS